MKRKGKSYPRAIAWQNYLWCSHLHRLPSQCGRLHVVATCSSRCHHCNSDQAAPVTDRQAAQSLTTSAEIQQITAAAISTTQLYHEQTALTAECNSAAASFGHFVPSSGSIYTYKRIMYIVYIMCIILYYVVMLCYVMLCCVVWCVMLCCVTLYYNILYYNIIHYITSHHII
jgi:hypothetical protein